MSEYYYTQKEIDFLKKNYKKMTLKELSEKIGRTSNGVKMKILKLGLNSPKTLKRRCLHCDKEFTTRDITKKYCCKECRYEEMKIRQHDYFQNHKKGINKKRAEQREKLRKQREKNIALSKKKKDLSAFFELYCLSIDTKNGIEKIRKFTKREDAEKIYRLLRSNFMKSKSI